MTDDTNTLNGALNRLGTVIADNLIAQGVEASPRDGLTTLANKILDIEASSSEPAYLYSPSDLTLIDDNIEISEYSSLATKISDSASGTSTYALTTISQTGKSAVEKVTSGWSRHEIINLSSKASIDITIKPFFIQVDYYMVDAIEKPALYIKNNDNLYHFFHDGNTHGQSHAMRLTDNINYDANWIYGTTFNPQPNDILRMTIIYLGKSIIFKAEKINNLNVEKIVTWTISLEDFFSPTEVGLGLGYYGTSDNRGYTTRFNNIHIGEVFFDD